MDFAATMLAMRHRAPVFLRVNTARTDLDGRHAALAGEGIAAQPVDWVEDRAWKSLTMRGKSRTPSAYLTGLVEVQDAASQAVIEAVPLQDGQRVLDLCAGGGGKTLAMAARARLQLWAHDAHPRRMVDLPARAKRAGAQFDHR